ncbi:hypothetical protein CLV98_11138 [Dyadobacter jejuensis]|uniref:Dolichyl-phosphate-mannose-protein mannosyltransferase n=1 Tax=Dyadobacter jejuensis TaxID=1082580 RepID=A0A316AHW5_9BACT|nr:hypothetical protein [Dyadobacter jejuensis]PWJ56544.1 hypothetical protein CLV98_11138 [Dyadobacter jejuensis]
MINFDTTPTVYWLLGFALAGLVVVSAYHKKVPTALFILLGLTLFVAIRLPVIVFNRELNPDESQMIGHAITLLQDPVYWRSVDGTTIGPLDNYFLTLPGLIGLPIDFTAARVMGLLANLCTLLFLWLCLRNWFSHRLSRVMWMMPLLLLGFTQEVDLVHYSSEQVPLLLLSLCLWLFSKLHTQAVLKPSHGYALGFAAGLIPFAKLQAVPPAVVLGASAAWICWGYFRKHKAPKPLLALLLGAITFPVIVALWAVYFGVFTDLIDFYLLGNVIYAGGNESSIFGQIIDILTLSPDFQAYLFLLALPIGLFVYGIIRPGALRNHQRDGLLLLTLFLFLLANVYAVTKSGNDFVHYLHFLTIPLLLLATWGMASFEKYTPLIPVILLAWFAVNDAKMYRSEHRLNAFDSVGHTTLSESPVVKALKKYAVKGDYMAVWGWNCLYYVEAQLAQATAENHTERSIFLHEMRDKYRERYMKDLARTQPAIILDAVGKNSAWVQDVPTQGIPSFAPLASYVSQHYTDLGIYDGTRLYVRTDRLR